MTKPASLARAGAQRAAHMAIIGAGRDPLEHTAALAKLYDAMNMQALIDRVSPLDILDAQLRAITVFADFVAKDDEAAAALIGDFTPMARTKLDHLLKLRAEGKAPARGESELQPPTQPGPQGGAAA